MVFPVVLPLFSGCGDNSAGTNPVLALWHNYGGQLKETMDEMIDKFNETVGAENGIIINVTTISGSAAIHENWRWLPAANREPALPI